MHLSDVITSPWAIQPEKLREICAVYQSHVHGETIDIAAVEARIGKPLISQDQGYTVRDGVAVIPVQGVIGKRMNMMTQISGGASTQLIERDIKAALADQSVNSILLHIDSPGGTVDGTQNLAEVVRQAKTHKPVVTFADGTMASAAYWIGSAADEVVSSSNTTQIGSIGVVMAHQDVSKAEEQAGIKTTEISAGKYKRITSQYAPLSEEGAAHMQEKVDQLYTIFVDEVAANLGTTPENVLERMADGKVFLSKEAQRRGMIDHIANMETTINNMAQGVWPMTKQAQTQEAQPAATVAMTIEKIKAEYPEVASAIAKEGAEAERARIQACESAGLAGHESIVNEMKFDGKSTAGDIALAIVAAENKLRTTAHAAFSNDAPKPVPLAAVPDIEKPAGAIDKTKPVEEWAKDAWDSDASIRAEFGNFEAYLGYEKANATGKLKIHATR